MTIENYLYKAKEAVMEAGSIIRDYRKGGNLGITFKDDGTPVTKVDKEAETRIRQILLSSFPDHGFIGEEFDNVESKNGYEWICDPVDGTWCLINGETTVSVSLALRYNDETVLATVYNPFTDELFAGADGIETRLNDTELPVYNRTDPLDAVYNFQISPSRKDDVRCLYEMWENKSVAKLVSRGGSVAYNLAQVAEGSHSVFITSSSKTTNIWDIAAGIYLVKSVGGMVTDHMGDELGISNPNGTLVASTNPEIHEVILELMSKVNFGN